MNIQRIELEWEEQQYFAIVIDNVFSADEAASLIRRSDGIGYDIAQVNIGGGRQQTMTDVRNNNRCIIDDPSLSALFWSRIQEACNKLSANEVERLNLHYLFQPRRGWYPVGLNERLRVLRYTPGTYFKPHYDGPYVRQDELGPSRRGEQSFVTCLLYLSEGAEGGETKFLSDFNESKAVKVEPKIGRVVLFQHRMLHEGSMLVDGLKHVVRTDVMYSSKGPWHEYSRDPALFANGDSEGDGQENGDPFRTP